MQPDSAVEETHQIRDKICANFEALRQHADGVMLEFGRTREQDLALRARPIRWQLRLREVFRLRIALLKYRLNLPGFELPAYAHLAQKGVDAQIAQRLDAIADRMSGRTEFTSGEEEPDEELIQITAEDLPSELDSARPRMRTLLPLLNRLESVLTALEHEILRSYDSGVRLSGPSHSIS